MDSVEEKKPKEEKPKFVVRTPTDVQRIRLERLMKNPVCKFFLICKKSVGKYCEFMKIFLIITAKRSPYSNVEFEKQKRRWIIRDAIICAKCNGFISWCR